MIIGCSASQKLAAKVAYLLNDYLCPVESRKFPDGERYLRVKGEVNGEVAVIQSTGYPQDENLVELFFMIKNLKDLGAETVRAVVPYFGYGRQEKRFKGGEAVSAKIVAELLEAAGADELITVNLHENCMSKFFKIPVNELSAMPLIAKHLSGALEDPVVIAPDRGALEHAREVSSIMGCECDYMEKIRLSPEVVETRVKDLDVAGKDAVIVDDIISTGGTIVNAAGILGKNRARSITVCCVHPVLVDDALIKIFSAGVSDVIATDTLKSEVSTISVAPLIADALRI